MAKESCMHVLMVDYDEDQKKISNTFGTSDKEVVDFLNMFIDSANAGEDETYTSKLMGLIKAGEVSGGLLLTLATQHIAYVLSNRKIEAMIDRILGDLQEPEDDESSD